MKKPVYAKNTEVPADRSRQEIERDLIRFGATGFSYGWELDRAMVEFLYAGRRIRLQLTMPPRADFTAKPANARFWNQARVDQAWEQVKRQRWRALSLVLKAKLVAVSEGIKSFEHEFGMDIVMPDGRTVADHVLPRVKEAYLTGSPRQELLQLPPAKDAEVDSER